MRTQGKVTYWNEEKGYGFVVPSSGAKRVFVHIGAFKNRQVPPKPNQIVSFTLSTDKQGRPCAVRVTQANEKQHSGIMGSQSVLMMLIALVFITVVGLSVLFTGMPIHILLLYVAASLITFVVYAKDKSAAQRDTWRTPESTLHVLSLVCGWPGAMIAQQTLRHKSRKEEFRAVFWVTVLLNCGVFVWLFTPLGAEMLQSVIARI